MAVSLGLLALAPGAAAAADQPPAPKSSIEARPAIERRFESYGERCNVRESRIGAYVRTEGWIYVVKCDDDATYIVSPTYGPEPCMEQEVCQPEEQGGFCSDGVDYLGTGCRRVGAVLKPPRPSGCVAVTVAAVTETTMRAGLRNDCSKAVNVAYRYVRMRTTKEITLQPHQAAPETFDPSVGGYTFGECPAPQRPDSDGADAACIAPPPGKP